MQTHHHDLAPGVAAVEWGGGGGGSMYTLYSVHPGKYDVFVLLKALQFTTITYDKGH